MIAPEKGRLLFLFIWYEATGAGDKALSTLHVCIIAVKKIIFLKKNSVFPPPSNDYAGAEETIFAFATTIRKQISSEREGGAGPRRPATNGGPHLWHPCGGKLEVTARARR